MIENIFTDWLGAEFTQGVSFGQFIELEILYTYDEVSKTFWSQGNTDGGISTVRLKILGKAFLKSESGTSVTFKL